MKRFLVGTAGHIDHGKTALVKALTGIDADRLPEEKRRGITIDLGFAHAEWEGVRLSFVDVPGHERFVRNMLAGAGGIDAVLLVIAADEAVMPQTREHFEIVRLLGIRKGLVAVTKIDRVAPELVEVTVSDARDLIRGSFLEGAEIVPVSSQTGEGLPELKRSLLRLALEEESSDREARGARLPIDRAFSIVGFGPVVTGSLVSGTISRDQRLELLPARKPVRVRRLEVHGRETEEARAGERVSANLAGVELEDVRRGVVLAAPGAFATSALLTARLELLAGAPPVKSGDRLSFHHYSSEARAIARVLDGRRPARRRDRKSPAPALPTRGGDSRRPLRRAASLARRDDRRRGDPGSSVAAGAPRDAGDSRRARAAGRRSLREAPRRGSSRPGRPGPAKSRSRPGPASAARKSAPPWPIRSLAAARTRCGVLPSATPVRTPSRAWRSARGRRSSEAFERRADRWGFLEGLSSRGCFASADPRWAEAVEKALVARGAYLVAGEEARIPGRDELAGAERELSARVAEAFRRRGLDPPSITDVAGEIGHKQKVIEGLAAYLVKKGPLLRLPGGWLIAREPVEEVIARLRGSGKQTLDVGEFKEMFGLTRRLAIPLLEHLDATKVTRRVGDARDL